MESIDLRATYVGRPPCDDVEMRDDDDNEYSSTDTEEIGDTCDSESDSSTMESTMPVSAYDFGRSTSMLNFGVTAPNSSPFTNELPQLNSTSLHSRSETELRFPVLQRTRSDIPGAIPAVQFNPQFPFAPSSNHHMFPNAQSNSGNSGAFLVPVLNRTRSDQPSPVPMQCFSIPPERKVGQKKITPPSPLEPNVLECARYNSYTAPIPPHFQSPREDWNCENSSEDSSSEDLNNNGGFRTPPKLLKPDSRCQGRWVQSQDNDTSPYAPSNRPAGKIQRSSVSFPTVVTPQIVVEEFPWSRTIPSGHQTSTGPNLATSCDSLDPHSNYQFFSSSNTLRQQLQKKSSPSEGSCLGLRAPVPMLKNIPQNLHKSTPTLQRESSMNGSLSARSHISLSRSETAPGAIELTNQYGTTVNHPFQVVDQKYITPATVSRLLRGDFHQVKKLIVIDCRYKYEYDGGHIRGAISVVPSENAVLLDKMFMRNPQLDESTVVIFHCEFSSKRGPDAWNHLRGWDRKENLSSYPNLYYPFMYIMQGGYKQFYDQYPEFCKGGYITMKDKRFSEDLLRNTRERKRGSGIRALSQSQGMQKENIDNVSPYRRDSQDGSVRQKSRKYRCMDRSNAALTKIPDRIPSSFGSGFLRSSVDGMVRSCSYDRDLSRGQIAVMEDLFADPEEEETLLEMAQSSAPSLHQTHPPVSPRKKPKSRISELRTNLSKRF